MANATARWGASTLGRVAAAYLQRVGRHATLHVTAADRTLDAVGSCGAFASRLSRDVAHGHVIVPFWSAHQITIGLLALEQFGLHSALTNFEIVADESFAGRIMQSMGHRLDLTMRRIHVRGNAKRLEDVSEWMRNPRPFFIAVDGGSAYGTVPTGIVRMASRLRSVVWPLAVRALPDAHLPGLIADFPLPRASIAVGIAGPIQIDRAMPVAAAAARIKQHIDVATEAADAVLRSGADEAGERVWMRTERAS